MRPWWTRAGDRAPVEASAAGAGPSVTGVGESVAAAAPYYGVIPWASAQPDWSAIAREVRRRRFGPKAPADWAEKGRQARFLQYRGFSNDHIRSALGPDLELDS